MAGRKHTFNLLSFSHLFLRLCLFTPACVCGPARAPLLAGQPFLVLWGVPDKDCLGRPNPAAFGMEWEGRVAIFYEDTLGLYPYFTAQDHPVNGGLPQHSSLDLHLQRVEGDLTASLPQTGAPGLGVLRWQEWAPQWNRNKGNKAKYLVDSRALLRGFFPDWSAEEVEKWSQVDFEAAAQSIIMETLWEVKRLRPQRLWGMAPYPNCYNFDSTQIALANYTGRCPAAEMALNDELMWLWKRSGALYPVLSLEKLPEGTKGAWLYATNQIREALRVAALAGTTSDLPVFPMIKIVYTSSNTFLSETDLVNTIGESAAMGASGVVIWEKSLAVKTQKSCSEFGSYVRQVLGPYAVNVTTAARLCGVLLCQGRGRCVRKKPEDPTYLHLPSPHFMLLPNGAEGVRATGELPTACVDLWKKNFRCQWFEALEGAAADQESGTVPENRGKITSPTIKTVIEISQSQSTVLPVLPEVPVTVVPTKQPVDSGSSALKSPVILFSSLVLFSFNV
ncbi:glyco_hydro_56 domain-containing protein [Pimephales promelas]|uniref:glyco_hydro_56 domain-containing protein n=1 Tax=Pimephales promelas TaxID=90988 RepID=UPI0019558D73|nr:glyco_hydro_56 domain-containing protein [Pimephales promelas]KAG1973767.1 hyaluronidase-2 [Pimephales promelas]